MLVSHHFPVDGEYVIRPKLWRNTVDVVRGTETPHDLEISIDGERVALTRFGGPEEEVRERRCSRAKRPTRSTAASKCA